jgi:hypothetical protein
MVVETVLADRLVIGKSVLEDFTRGSFTIGGYVRHEGGCTCHGSGKLGCLCCLTLSIGSNPELKLLCN